MKVLTGGTVVLLVTGVGGLPARQWNSPGAVSLAMRAMARRATMGRDAAPLSYTALARGLVTFEVQAGRALAGPPIRIKTDQVAVAVSRRAPGPPRQRIVGWRELADLPTDIRYHRDHLALLPAAFGTRIGLGEGHEVRDVLHPLAPGADSVYDYALGDAIVVALPAQTVTARRLQFRPKDPTGPAAVGEAWLDVTSADLIVLEFGFTRAAFRDATLEDIVVRLEQGLWEGRYWLPRQQDLTIRRRGAWLDFPMRGIIRTHFVVEDYRFDVAGLRVGGPLLVVAPEEERNRFVWSESLGAVVARGNPSGTPDPAEVRSRVRRLVGASVVSGLPRWGLGASRVSDVIGFNRVEGLRLGVGGVVRPRRGRLAIRGWLGRGWADGRWKARLEATHQAGGSEEWIRAFRVVRDIADEPVIAPLLNALGAQELGVDFGDYYLTRGVAAGGSVRFPAVSVSYRGSIERIARVAVRARSAAGTFRPNPDLGDGVYRRVDVALASGRSSYGMTTSWSGMVAIEAGSGRGVDYGRLTLSGTVTIGSPSSGLVFAGFGGLGSAGLPAHRSFSLGGRGTLPGTPFRRWGGRSMVAVRAEGRVPIPAPRLGSGLVDSGSRVVLAPFVAAGWAGRSGGLPWKETGGGQGGVGVGLEWFHRLLRFELGRGVREGGWRFGVSLRSEFRDIL